MHRRNKSALGPIIKDVYNKAKKINLIPPCPQNVLTISNPLLLCLCGHTLNFEKFEMFLPKNVDATSEEHPLLLVRKMSALYKPLCKISLEYVFTPMMILSAVG